ncbi:MULTISPECIES: DMT family transporter [Staphylococcus]|uniref:Integral membrane protein n=1 Tax=Staphylococcus schleiferi TaxID=1295 RepID=A0A7Z7QR41_STASC|nr:MULTISPECIES: DMT family transporter [Staphylococcus]QGS46843.1 EamA-like transporter family protein [Mammaliicoccus fleurettii]EPD53367.1 hypothetical protein HMPREF1208_00101 [Staphylococcus sp. HGB0015]NHA33870.1 hypothetical protein [Staphylococcus schleiferi]NHA38417.1 hypothetical protein [Staphylococcus schleiferi]NHA40533.1 hypothetical protein [Staphylococcus schleiferi]
MLSLLLILGLIAGSVVPIQTSINSKLSLYTHSSFYASAISFSTGTLWLIIVNLIMNPHVFSMASFRHYQIDYYWYVGGLMGVIFLTGNLLLLPKIGASLTVVTTIAGQILMSVVIDSFGWFNVDIKPLSILKAFGILLLLIGIILMNIQKRSKVVRTTHQTPLWIIVGILFGFAPPIQTAINSHLGQSVHSPYFASLISFTVGSLALILLTLIVHRKFSISTFHASNGPLKWWHFIGGALGVIFVTTNIILTPHIGVTFTLITVMLGQIIMGMIIDHFGLLGVPPRRLSSQRLIGFVVIIIAIVLIQLR